MKVVLTHGYFLNEDEKEQKIMKPYPPLGLLYITAFLRENSVDTHVFDSTFSSREVLTEYLAKEKPEVIGMYTNLMTKVNVIHLIELARNILPEVKVILGGPDVTYNTSDYLKYGADYVIIGEGEQTMLELIQCIKVNGMFTEVDGIAFLDKGHEITTKARQQLRDINDLPDPARDAIDISKYLKVWKDFHGASALNISTQRGCPYTCKWCSTAVYGQTYRRRSPKLVVAEIKEIQERYQPDTLWFVDDVFTVSHKWLSSFADELRQQQVMIRFECITRADRMNAEVIQTLKNAGCFRVWIGAESGSQKVIDAMDRRVSVEKVRKIIQETRKTGIEAGTFIMLGYPGETEEDIEETIYHLKESNPDHFTITVAYPIKGTRLFEEIKSSQIAQPEWNKTTDRDRDFKRTYPKKYYRYAVTKVVNEVNYHKLTTTSGLGFKALKMKTKAVLAGLGMKVIRNLG